MLGQNLEMSIKTRKNVHINIRLQTLIFWSTAPRSYDVSPLILLS